MTFTTVPSGYLDVGDPVKKELLDLYKSNEDDLNTRLTAVEAFGAGLDIWNGDIRSASDFATLTTVLVKYISKPMTINDCFIQVYELGSLTGDLEIDVKRATSLNGTYTSIFTTLPSIDAGVAADYAVSTNQVLSVSQVDLSVGDYLKLDITSMPTSGTLSKFKLVLTAEAT